MLARRREGSGLTAASGRAVLGSSGCLRSVGSAVCCRQEFGQEHKTHQMAKEMLFVCPSRVAIKLLVAVGEKKVSVSASALCCVKVALGPTDCSPKS